MIMHVRVDSGIVRWCRISATILMSRYAELHGLGKAGNDVTRESMRHVSELLRHNSATPASHTLLIAIKWRGRTTIFTFVAENF